MIAVDNSSLYSIVQIITIVLKILAFEKEKKKIVRGRKRKEHPNPRSELEVTSPRIASPLEIRPRFLSDFPMFA